MKNDFTKNEERSRSLEVLRLSADLLPKSDKLKFFIVVMMQFLLAILDLVGVAIIGIIGALSITGINSASPGNRTQKVLTILKLDNLSFQTQVVSLAFGATFFLILRTIFSVVLSRKVLIFLSNRGALISENLVSKLLTQSLLNVRRYSSQDTLFALTSGIQNITTGIIGTFINLISDFSLLLLLGVGLFLVDWVTAIAAILFFAFVTIIVYFVSSNKSHYLGKENTQLGIESAENILEVLALYRELTVRNRREFYARKIAAGRYKIASVLAQIQFLPNISKYVMESSMVVGALFLASVQFFLSDAKHAFATLTVFLAAGTRIAPAVMRLQQGLIQLKGSIGSATPSLVMAAQLTDAKISKPINDQFIFSHGDFHPTIELSNVSFQYPDSNLCTLSNIDLNVLPGEFVAVVGPSGAGKSTLIDVVLGLIDVAEGQVAISGLQPSQTVEKWPGAIAYVPQNVIIINGTIKQNLGIGFPVESISDHLFWEALEIAQMNQFVEGLPGKLSYFIQEDGSNLSGGQRQRLGIARALLTKPRIIILDEATSSLDAQTEEDISQAINNLRGEVTTLTIAHRLSTVKNAHKIIYIDGGRILASGKFDEVRTQVPDFDRQAQLMGL